MLRARLVAFADIDERLIDQWKELEAEAVEPNAYLSPHFIIPAVRYLTPNRAPHAVLIEKVRHDSTRQLRGIGFVVPNARTRALPVSHFETYQSIHAFVDGLLVSKCDAEGVAAEYLKLLAGYRPRNHGVWFRKIAVNRPVFQLLSRAAKSGGLSWYESGRFERAILDLRTLSDVAAMVPKGVRKDILRRKRRLSEKGVLDFRIRIGANAGVDCVDNHLRLENMGWKGKRGKSMLAQPNAEQFFRELSLHFLSEGRACFSEILLNGEVIASTSNFLSGNELFAFKIGWNPEYSKFSPGVMNELNLIDSLKTALPQVKRLDSGTEGNSYVDQILVQRETMVSGYFSLSGLGETVLSLMSAAWPVKRRLAAAVRGSMSRWRK